MFGHLLLKLNNKNVLRIILISCFLIIIYNSQYILRGCADIGLRKVADPICLYEHFKIFGSDDFLVGFRWREHNYKCGGHYTYESPSISSDGSKIVSGCTRFGGYGDICQFSLKDNRWTRLTNIKAYDGEPSLSSDGNKIVFVSERDGNGEIYIMDSDGSNQKRLTNSDVYDSWPKFSPDNTKIFFTTREYKNSESTHTKPQIIIMNVDGSGSRVLTSNKTNNSFASFANNGNKIVYVSNEEINTGEEFLKYKYKTYIATLNLDTMEETKYKVSGRIRSVTFSPDDKKLFILGRFFLGEKNKEPAIYSLDLKNSNIEKIMQVEDAYYPLSFIEGENKIMYFVQKNRHGGDICTVKLDGSDFQVITSTYN